MGVEREDLVATARVALCLTALAVVVSVVVHLAAAEDVRGFLGFTFPGVPERLGEARAIFVNNARIMLAVVVAGGVVQAAVRANAEGLSRGAMTAMVRFCDVALVLFSLIQIVIVGAAIGAYGGETLGTILPHLPFELAAFSLVLAVYLRARREPLRARHLIVAASVAAVLLCVGAFVEVYA